MSDIQLDQALVDRARQGDQYAFNVLVAKYQSKLRRLLSQFIHDPTTVEDVVRETVLTAYRELHNFRGDSAFYTWFYRIGVNLAKKHLPSQKNPSPKNMGFDSQEAVLANGSDRFQNFHNPAHHASPQGVGSVIHSAMDALPDKFRSVITLRELEGFSCEEIAKILDCPIDTVRARILKAREMLAVTLRSSVTTATDKRW